MKTAREILDRYEGFLLSTPKDIHLKKYLNKDQAIRDLDALVPKKKEINKEKSCNTCEHKDDSSIEYCGSCNGIIESNWTANSIIVGGLNYNQAIDKMHKIFKEEV